MKTLDMSYAKQSLFYNPDDGWQMNRHYCWKGRFFFMWTTYSTVISR